MGLSLVHSLFRRSAGAFVRAARARGVRARSAAVLEAAAHEISPEDPTQILESRQLFEAAATRAVIGDGDNLELSFGLVDELASAVEALGLARASDVPDPFRRVWIRNGAGRRMRGTVLTCKAGELAVFCPPAERHVAEIGAVLWLQYRGFNASVEYDLQLDDSIRLPGALVLHLKRRSGQGDIGRNSVRHPIQLTGHIRPLVAGEEAAAQPAFACVFTDVSAGGMALECAPRLEQGSSVRLEVFFPDDDSAFSAEAVVRWAREKDDGLCSAGIAFSNLPRPRAERLERYLRALSDHTETGSPHVAESARAAAADSTSSGQRATHSQRQTKDSHRFDGSFFQPDVPHDADSSEAPQQAAYDPAMQAFPREQDLVARIFQSVAEAMTGVTRPFVCGPSHAERRQARVPGAGAVHISFKFSVDQKGSKSEGCLLIPLPDALALAGAYLVLSDENLLESRTLDAPDPPMKEALMQLGEIVAAAIDSELFRATHGRVRVRPLGCQGVRANVRPAFRYSEGAELLVGRTQARFLDSPFAVILMLPTIEQIHKNSS